MESKKYWIERYENGGNSGAGSYGRLAWFKADFINSILKRYEIKTVAEIGCGDGNQLALYKFEDYTGYDISPKAVNECAETFPQYNFAVYPEYGVYPKEFDLVLSIDVIYHLFEDNIFKLHISNLFMMSQKYVVIYSTNDPNIHNTAEHIKHRRFTDWVEANRPDFDLIHTKKNRYPYNGDTATTSFCDFFIYKKTINETS